MLCFLFRTRYWNRILPLQSHSIQPLRKRTNGYSTTTTTITTTIIKLTNNIVMEGCNVVFLMLTVAAPSIWCHGNYYWYEHITLNFWGDVIIYIYIYIYIYMHQSTGSLLSLLVHVMVCHQFGARPLPAPMLIYYQLNHQEHASVNFETQTYFKMRLWKCRLQNNKMR